jgi:hypothetical protein
MPKRLKPYILVLFAIVFALALGSWLFFGQPTKSQPTSFVAPEFVYKEDVRRLIARLQHDQIVFGYLDAQGEFRRDRHLLPISPPPETDEVLPLPSPDNLVQPAAIPVAVINKPKRPDEPVYEFRSGSLIAGTLDHDGNFVPQVDSEILPASKYKYSPTARRIYNLPGTFVPKNPQPSDPTLDLY